MAARDVTMTSGTLLLVTVFVCLQTIHSAMINSEDDGSSTNTSPDLLSRMVGIACEGSSLTIKCNSSAQILITRVMYGRMGLGQCSNGRTDIDLWEKNCMSVRAFGIVADRCDNKSLDSCIIRATNRVFGDPCPNTPKYLEVVYKCETASKSPPVNTSDSNSGSSAPIIVSPTRPTSSAGTVRSTTYPYWDPGAAALPILPSETESGGGFCNSTWARNINWPQASAGQTVEAECPNNKKVRKARWTCGGKGEVDSVGGWKKRPDLSQCVSQTILGLQDLLNTTRFAPGLIGSVADDMVTASGLGEVIYGGDLTHLTSAMEKTVEEIQVHVHELESNDILKEVNDAVLKTTSNLLDKKRADSWKDLPQATQAETATRLIDSVEKSAFQVAKSIQKPTIVINITVNVVVEIRVVNITATESPPDFSFSANQKPRYSKPDHKKKEEEKPYQKPLQKPTTSAPTTTTTTEKPRKNSDDGNFQDSGNPDILGDNNGGDGSVKPDTFQPGRGGVETIFDEPHMVEDYVWDEMNYEVGYWDGYQETKTGESFLDTTWSNCTDTITLSGPTIKELAMNGLVKVVFATYENLDEYMQPRYVTAAYGQDGMAELHVQHNNMITRVPLLDNVQEQKGRDTVTVTFSDPEFGADGASDEGIKVPVDREEDEKLKDKIVNTRIISASVNDKTTGLIKLAEPVIYTLEHITTENVYDPSCSFWEYSEKTMNGKWSTFGCELLETNTTHTKCACEHLTNFAVLMAVTKNDLHSSYEFALALLTYFGGIPSVLCLFAAFITFCAFKNLQCDRNTIHKNLVLTLFIAEVVFLGGIAQTAFPTLCSVIALVLHYLFLTAFAWMCIEGVQLYFMLVEVFEAERSRVRWYYAAGYGLPAVIVIVSAAINFGGYGTKKYCWLSTDNGFIWAFVGPVCAIITVNIIMLSIAIFVMCRHANNAANQWKMKQKTQLENIRTWVMGAVVLVVLLGLTWIFGIFFMSERTVFMAFVFVSLNISQGFFIFLFHCLMNEKVQKEYKRFVRHSTWLPESFRVWYGGAKASSSSTPNNSSSSGVNYLTRLLSNRRHKRSSTTTLATSSVPGRYNPMQRSSDTTSAGDGRGSALNDRFSAEPDDFGVGAESHIYSEPTEDPCAYLEPVKIRLDPDEEWGGGECSMMEGSIADTDYMDRMAQRGPKPGPSGAQRAASPRSLNIDKYKIRPLEKSEDSATLTKQKPQESDYSDGELFDKLIPVSEACNSYTPDPASSTNQNTAFLSEDSLIRRKLLPSDEDEIPTARPNGKIPSGGFSSPDRIQPKRGEIMAGVAKPPGGEPPPLPQRLLWNQRPGGSMPSDC